jgi:hypothetical protein
MHQLELSDFERQFSTHQEAIQLIALVSPT